MQVALFLQKFHDSRGRSPGNGQHHKDHGKHHQTHENLSGISNQTQKFPGGKSGHRIAAGSHNGPGAKPGYEKDTGIHAKLHQRHIKDQQPLSFAKVLVNGLGNSHEFLGFKIFADKRLDHAHAPEIFLNDIIELIIGPEDPGEDGMNIAHNQP